MCKLLLQLVLQFIITYMHVHAKLLQSCPTLCNPMDCSPPGSSVHGILHARILEWVAIPSSRRSSWPRVRTHVSHVSYWQMHSLPLAPPGKPIAYMNVAKSLKKDNRVFRARNGYCESIKDPLLGSKYLPIRSIRLFTFQRFINQIRKKWNNIFKHSILQYVSKV